MQSQSGGGFAFSSDKENPAKNCCLSKEKISCNDDTAELPDIKKLMDTGFTVEEDITYIHTDERI